MGLTGPDSLSGSTLIEAVSLSGQEVQVPTEGSAPAVQYEGFIHNGQAHYLHNV